MPPMPPMPPPPCMAGAVSFLGASATMASVVISRPATEAASWSAARGRFGSALAGICLWGAGIRLQDPIPEAAVGNRTRVPWHFSAGFYVCSLSTFGRPEPCGPAAPVRPTGPRQAGSPQDYPVVSLAIASPGTAGPCGPASGDSEPDLASEP
jgi:hypothetical protein